MTLCNYLFRLGTRRKVVSGVRSSGDIRGRQFHAEFLFYFLFYYSQGGNYYPPPTRRIRCPTIITTARFCDYLRTQTNNIIIERFCFSTLKLIQINVRIIRMMFSIFLPRLDENSNAVLKII